MPSQEMPPGPTGQRVAENVAALREDRGYTKTELGRLLAELGRPMTIDVLVKLEGQRRRVDADDLVALALALRCTPNRLLLPGTAGDAKVPLTPARSASERDAWSWVCGEHQLPAARGEGYRLQELIRFPKTNRPHRDRDLTREEQERYKHVLGPILKAVQHASEAGVPAAGLVGYVEAALDLKSTMTWLGEQLQAAALQDGEEDDNGR